MRRPRRRAASPADVALPPAGWGKAGIFLGWDPSAKWGPDGIPLCEDWWEAVVLGGARNVAGQWVTEATCGVAAGPGAGKSSGLLAGAVAFTGTQGPMVIGSTRPDLVFWTSAIRSKRGGKVQIIDWKGQQAASLPWPRVRWSPLDGCADPSVCGERIDAMMDVIEMGRPQTEAFWHVQAGQVLSAYCHSAALEGSGMTRVLAWLRRGELLEPQRIIEAHGSRAGFGEELAALAGPASETRDSVMASARLVFASLSDPAVLDGCTPSAEDAFDIDRFLDGPSTLYLLDKGSKSAVSKQAPLTVALVNAILERAEARADATPPGPGGIAGRLYPGLTLILDEVSNISPLPALPQILSQARGRGITVIFAIQSRSQLNQWGEAGAKAILDTSAYLLVGAGLGRDQEFLTTISKSLGERHVWRPSVGEQHPGGSGPAHKAGSSESWSLMETPNLKASALASLPEGSAVLMGREGWRVVQIPALPGLEPFRTMMMGDDAAPVAECPPSLLPAPEYGPEYGPEDWCWPPASPPWWRRLLRSWAR
ncbi:MAG TPA: TraM recognition domain-containing protein [Candidatus Saccharimonadales bacterium]|nr:TraM recognition domain-containing protein [Candidatus Saccharimonadales bacterium]